MNEKHEHNWMGHSILLSSHRLMLECAVCLAKGIVEDPTDLEWADAFFLPCMPYSWTEPERVVIFEGW